MIAEVYPLRRMSRAMGVLDYLIPDTMKLRRGMFVTVPIRSMRMTGVVRRVKDKPPRGIRLKQVIDIVPQGALRDKELSFFEEIADSIAQPVSSLMYTALPRYPKRHGQRNAPALILSTLTIARGETPTIARLAGCLSGRQKAFVQSPDLKRSAAIISGYRVLNPDGKILILCPTVHDTRVLAHALCGYAPECITGNETNNERYAAWRAFRESDNGMLIATRAGLFYGDARTAAIFVVRSGHPLHVQHDRNPRLDARRVLQKFSEHMDASIFFLDVYPRPEDILYFGEDHLFNYTIAELPTFVDNAKEKPVSGHPALCSTSIGAMVSALEQGHRVLLVYNKKRYADNLARLNTRGYGIKQIAQAVEEFFRGVSCDVIDAEHPRGSNSQIVLVTSWYLENLFNPMRPESFGCVVHLDPDTPLYSPDFRAAFRAVWSVAQWRGVAHAMRASFFVQTDEPEWFAEKLHDPQTGAKEELKQRMAYGQPPFREWATVRSKDKEIRRREIQQYQIKETLERIDCVEVSVQDEVVSVRFDSSAQYNVLDAFSRLDDRYIIDMNAFSD